MLTRRDLIVKWSTYAAASLALVFLHTLLLRDVELLGVRLFLPPLLVAVVASVEDTRAGAIFGLVCRGYQQKNDVLFWVFMAMLIVTIFRELVVASIRLVASTSGGVVVAANMLGKLKTVFQMICIIAALAEPVIFDVIGRLAGEPVTFGYYPVAYLSAAIAVVLTVWSGVNYLAAYWKFLDPEK